MKSRQGPIVRHVVVVAAVAVLVVMVLAGLTLAGVIRLPPSSAPTAPWRENVSLAASALMLVLLVAGLVSMRRARVLNLHGWPGVWSLPRAQRR